MVEKNGKKETRVEKKLTNLFPRRVVKKKRKTRQVARLEGVFAGAAGFGLVCTSFAASDDVPILD